MQGGKSVQTSKNLPWPDAFCGLVAGKLSARGSLTSHEANVAAFLLGELLAKSFPPKCQELWAKPCQRVWENADHIASSGARGPGPQSLPSKHCLRVGKAAEKV